MKLLIIIIIATLLLFTCEEPEREIMIETVRIQAIGSTSVTVSGNIIDLGEGITRYGHQVIHNNGSQTFVAAESYLSQPAQLGAYTSTVDGLLPNVDYSVRAYARKGSGVTVYGKLITFTTPFSVPAPIAAFTASPTAIAAGESVQFTDQSTNSPTSWNWNFGDGGTSTAQSPSHVYSTVGIYTVTLTVANNSGSDVETKTDYITVESGSTGETGTFKDSRDGTVYNWVSIGNQVWMAENLAYLPSVSPLTSGSSISPHYYVGNYDGTSVNLAKSTSYYATYGVLYNWPAAMNGEDSSFTNPSGVKGVCPSGWHLPSNIEWQMLIDTLGGWQIAGGKLKEFGYVHWASPNIGATNSSGFTALPGGARDMLGDFYGDGAWGLWWSTSAYEATYAGGIGLEYNSNIVGDYGIPRESGVNVRCVQD